MFAFMNSNLYKGSLETIVIDLLSKHKEMYGYQITKLVKELSHGSIEIKEGSLYPLLHKMESKGLIESYILNIGNRDRKYYKLSEKGHTEKSRILAEMETYLTVMKSLLNPKTI
jgi:DNA-binding PadR family transcriptional regulator